MKESNDWLQLGRVEGCNAGLELGLQVVLHDAHVSYPDWEHVLIQGVHQGEELIQVLVLGTKGERVSKTNVGATGMGESKEKDEKQRNMTKINGKKKKVEVTKLQ